ncbi:MAG: hypothetical protein ACREBW_06620 [Candidatus Micrarchaeaceae archaeon]
MALQVVNDPSAYSVLAYMSELFASCGWSLDHAVSNQAKIKIVELSADGLFREVEPNVIKITPKGRELLDYIQNHSGLRRCARESMLKAVFNLPESYLRTLQSQEVITEGSRALL